MLRPTLRIVGLCAVVVLAAAALALSNTPAAVIHACANRHTGALRLLGAHGRCKASERAVSWSQTGPHGIAGVTGATGATGTVDTSNFYTKAQSDSRYASTAYGQSMQVRYLNSSIAAGTSGQLYPALLLGRLSATCADPATSADLQYTFEGGASGTIQRTHAGTTTFGTSDTSLATAQNDHVQYLVSYSTGTVANLDVWVANGPSGNNECDFNVFATIVNP